MTISDLELCQNNTANLAFPHNFYPTKISVHHHQLRHFISTAEQNRIYYVDNFDVFVLDLKTKQTTLLATVPFEARCLAADYGWVCVGGEQNGDCAFIRIEEEDGIPKCFGHDLNVDVLGGEIVNSMNIHIMRNWSGEDEPVVLISNNDKTVKIFSLAQREVLTTLDHAVPVNYATMSPDSTIIAVVGDTDTVHFYRRDRVSLSESKYPEYEWLHMASPVIPTGEEVYDDHSFAVAFSPSGNLCAASAQGGAISIFDMRLLGEHGYAPEDAILCTFRSSRPALWGCVRAMAFSPEPWDLLAWAEDHGRVGIADIRQMFVRRQVLDLDKQIANTVDVQDGTPPAYRGLGVKEKLKQQHLARLRSMRGLRGSRADQGRTEGNVDRATSDETRFVVISPWVGSRCS